MIMALLVLSVIVLFHEFGHFLLARINGIAVVEFSLGFGPRILSWESKKSGTRYSWKIIPFGGSCAMYGEFEDEDSQTQEEKAFKAKFGDGSHGESFFKKSPLARMSVIAAGPIFNFILAFIFAIFVLAWAGYDAPVVAGVTEGQAAEAAGIEAGDVITKIGKRKIVLMREILLSMINNGNKDVAVQFERLNEEAGVWETHEVMLDSDLFGYQDGRYQMGIKLGGNRTGAESLPKLIQCAGAEVRYNILAVIESLKMMAAGQVSGDDIAGPIRIVTIIDDTVEQAAPAGAVAVMMNVFNLIVSFSANLGVMNLIPFPALDGGRIVFLLWEFLTGRPVNQKVETAVNFTGMALLMVFMVLVVFNDLRILF